MVFGITENPGGVESFLINYYRHIDKERIQCDFLCNTYEKVAYEEELTGLGGRIFRTHPRKSNPLRFRKELDTIFKEHCREWSAIWVNVCSLANVDYLKIAKKYGINKRIIHSHNSQNMDSVLRGILHRINKGRLDKWATDYWACSEDASRWFYKKTLINKAVIIHNAIDVDEMRFDEKKRTLMREEYGWNNKYIIGNVGRLHFQKNQSFMIDVFRIYCKNHPESLLVLVGQGEDEDKLKLKVKECGLEEKVFFAGLQRDIQGWFSCFDLFLFPSKFEGLSIAALEAQASGIPALASKGVIPEAVRMCDNFCFYELEQGAEMWSRKLDEVRAINRVPFETVKSNFAQKGFDVSIEAQKLEEVFLENESGETKNAHE